MSRRQTKVKTLLQHYQTISLKTTLAASTLKRFVAVVEDCSETFHQSPLNPDGTESKVWIEPLEKAELGQKCICKAVSESPGFAGVPKTWETYIRSHEFHLHGTVTVQQLLVLPFRTKSRTSRAESRKTYQRLPGGPIT